MNWWKSKVCNPIKVWDEERNLVGLGIYMKITFLNSSGVNRPRFCLTKESLSPFVSMQSNPVIIDYVFIDLYKQF